MKIMGKAGCIPGFVMYGVTDICFSRENGMRRPKKGATGV